MSRERGLPGIRHKRLTLTIILALVFIWSLTSIEWSPELIHAGGGAMILEILEGLISPALSPEILRLGLESSWITLTYAVAGMSLAIIYAFFAGVLASGVLT